VSLANATLGVGSELGWVVYTLQGSLWSAVPEAAIMALTNALLAVALVHTGIAVVRPFIVSAAWAMILVAGTTLGGFGFLGALLPIAYAVQVVPSICSAYRTWAPSGIAITTWLLILVECLLWGVYGALHSDPAMVTLGMVGTGASAAIVVRVMMTRDRVLAVRRLELATGSSSALRWESRTRPWSSWSPRPPAASRTARPLLS
jgi:hypothetical protein